jgi:hypothetical protein
MKIQIFGYNPTTSSLFRNGSSSSRVDRGESARRRRALIRVSFASILALGPSVGIARSAAAQTPTTPPAEQGQQPGQQPVQAQPQPGQPATPEQQQIPLQQFPIQQPGRPPITPATPPSTTLPPWTPPVPPAPSQTNIPTPFPYATPGAPGTPGFVGVPGLTVPGAFAPTVTTIRGATLEFHPTARVSEEYSDNFFQETSRTQENFRSTVGPGFTLFLNGARTFGVLSTTVDLVHDTAPNSGDEVKVFPSLNMAIRYALTPRLALTLSDTFIRDDAAGTADQFGIRRGRQTFNTNTLSLAADWLLDQVALQAYYRNVLFFNEGSGQTTNNNEDTVTHILGLNASTRFAIDYVVRAGYEISRSDTVNGGGNNDGNTSHTVFASVARQFGLYTTAGLSSSFQYQIDNNTKIYNASLFGAYGLPSGLSLAASVGYSILDSDQQDNEGTVSASASASYRFTRAVISVGVFQDFRQTAQQGQNFGTVETRTYFGSFLYQLTPFINTVLSVNYSENSPTGTGNVDNSRTQTALTYGASVNWQILRWLSANLQYTYTKQEGNNAFDQQAGNGNFAENRAIVRLFATF